MGLLHHDNFNHYGYSQAASSGEVTNIVQTVGTVAFSAGEGRDSLTALRILSGASCFNTYWRKTVAAADAEHYQGARLRVTTMPGTVGGVMSCMSVGSAQITLALQSDGTLAVVKGSIEDYLFTSGAVLGSTTFALATGIRYFVELGVYVHSSAGWIVVRVNGDVKLTLTGKNTNPAGSGSWNGALLGNFGNGGNPFIKAEINAYYNDWYVLDGVAESGPVAFDDFLGDCKTTVVLPTAAGAHADGTLSAGSDRVAVVDDATPNDDTDYVELANVGDQESWQYVLPTVVGGGGILACTLAAWQKKTDAGSRSLRDVVRAGGVDYVGGADHALGTSYAFERFTRLTNPATSAEFSSGATVEFGLKVTV